VRAGLQARLHEAAVLAGAPQVVDVDPRALDAVAAQIAQAPAHDDALAVDARGPERAG
jgi:hypothetical protein